jgi:hypothetical protein
MSPVHKISQHSKSNQSMEIEIENTSPRTRENASARAGACNIFNLEMIGNNYIFLKTDRNILLTVGPHWPGVCVTLAIIFFGTYENYLSVTSLSMKILVFGFCFFTTTFLLLTACTDPGKYRSNRLILITYFHVCFKGIVIMSPVPVDEESCSQMSYCDICSIHQEEKTYHCRDCNCCIQGSAYLSRYYLYIL